MGATPLGEASRRANREFLADAELRQALKYWGFCNVTKVGNGYIVVERDCFASFVIEHEGGHICTTHGDSMLDRCVAIVVLVSSLKEGKY